MPTVHAYPEHNFAVFARDARDCLETCKMVRSLVIVLPEWVLMMLV